MRHFISQIKDKFSQAFSDDIEEDREDYVELGSSNMDDNNSKVIVRPFVIENFEDIKTILDVFRAGKTIALINIRPIKDRDIIELKRAVSKLKKTCDALDGDIAGFGEDWIVITPNYAKIYRTSDIAEVSMTD